MNHLKQLWTDREGRGNYDSLYVLGINLTPDEDMLWTGFFSSYLQWIAWIPGLEDALNEQGWSLYGWTSLREVAEEVSPTMEDWVDDCFDKCLYSVPQELNIITDDFYDLSDLVKTVQAINRQKLDVVAPKSSALVESSSGEHGWLRSPVKITLQAQRRPCGLEPKDIRYRIDGDTDWHACGPQCTLEVLDDGFHTVYFQSQDIAGDWERVQQVNFAIDSTPPDGTIELNEGATTTSSALVRVGASASDATSGIYQMRLGDAVDSWTAWRSYTDHLLWQLPSPVTGQPYTVEAQFQDRAGNISAVASDDIVLDIYPDRPSSANYDLVKSTWGASGTGGSTSSSSSHYVRYDTLGQPSLIGHLNTSSNYTLASGYWAGYVFNTAPTLDASRSPALDAIKEDEVTNNGTLVWTLILRLGRGGYTDPNGPQAGLAVIGVDNSHGTWQYNTGTGWTAFASPTASAARLLAADDGTRIRFVPNANWNGTVDPGITFRAWDQFSGSNGGSADTTHNGGTTAFSTATETASITVNPVNDAPVAQDDGGSVCEGWAWLDFPPGVLRNDSDVDAGDSLTAELTSGPQHGSVWLDADGSFSYGCGDYNGQDSFAYRASDGLAVSNIATVTINCRPRNDAPQFTSGGDVAVDEDSGLYNAPWASNILPGPPNESGQVLTFTVTNDTPALFSVQPDVDESSGDLSFTPAPNANGSAVVTATLQDSGGTAPCDGVDTSPPQTFNITVNPVNDAPKAEAGDDQAAHEGDTVSFDGSHSSDLDDDVLSFTWDFGDGSSGTGDIPSHVYADNGVYTVTLTVTDGLGGIDDDTLVVTVNNAAPTATIEGAPADSPEGTPIHLTSTVSDPGSADTFTYAWEVTKNGSPYGSGTSSNFSFTPDDNGTYLVSLTVTDDDGGESTANASIEVNNVAPSVGPINAPTEPVVVGTEVTASASFRDPGRMDRHTAVWVWGDGASTPGTLTQGAGSGSVKDRHTYERSGRFTIRLTVTDDDGGKGSARHTLILQSPSQAIESVGDEVENLDLPQGLEKELTSKLNNALRDLERGQDQGAVNKLNAFIHSVKAQRGKKISAAEADALIQTVQEIINAIRAGLL